MVLVGRGLVGCALVGSSSSDYRDLVQATVLTFDSKDGSGSVLFDDGRALPFPGEVFLASGLRLLRPGQRLRVTLDDDCVSALTIVTLEDMR